MYQIFFLFFYISVLKWSKNTKQILIWRKEKNKKNFNFFQKYF